MNTIKCWSTAVALVLLVLGAGEAATNPIRIDPPPNAQFTSAYSLSLDGKTVVYGLMDVGVAPSEHRPWYPPAVVLCDAVTGKEVRRIPLDFRAAYLTGAAFSPDGGRLLLSADWTAAVWDLTKGEKIREWNDAQVDWSPDGAKLVGRKNLSGLGSPDPDLHVWDASTGKELCQFGSGGPYGPFSHCAISADGRHVAVEHVQSEPLTDKREAPGKLEELLPRRFRPVVDLWDSSTGKRLGTAGAPAEAVEINKELWDATGHLMGDADLNAARQRNKRLPDQLAMVGAETWAFRVRALPGEHYLLLPAYRDLPPLTLSKCEEKVFLSETATGKVLRKFADFEKGICWPLLSPDCNTLVVKGQESLKNSSPSKILIWDVSDLKRACRGTAPEFDAKELSSLWDDLAAADATKANRAMRALAAGPDKAAPFLASRLRPADASAAPALVADLNSDDLDTREMASRELAKLGEAARPLLEKAAGADAPAETRRRAAELLDKLKGPIPPDDLRGIRAVDVLERIGTDEARKSLKALAAGAPGALLTQAARDALERLNEKP